RLVLSEAESSAHDLGRAQRAPRGAREQQGGLRAAALQPLAHAGRVALAALGERPVGILEHGVLPARLRVAEQDHGLHGLAVGARVLHGGACGRHNQPPWGGAPSDIPPRSDGGSTTTSPAAPPAVGMISISPRPSSARMPPIPHPGAVNVFLIAPLPPPLGAR